MRAHVRRSPLDEAAARALVTLPGTLLLLPSALESVTEAAAEVMLDRRGVTIAMLEGEAGGCGLAVALDADWVAAVEGSRLGPIEEPLQIAAAVRRAGRRILPLLAAGGFVAAHEAAGSGLVDTLVPDGCDWLEWAGAWLGSRSMPALEAGAALIRRHGGDPLERAQFARLFATGEPQRGLNGFLDRTPVTTDAIEWEIS